MIDGITTIPIKSINLLKLVIEVKLANSKISINIKIIKRKISYNLLFFDKTLVLTSSVPIIIKIVRIITLNNENNENIISER